MKNIAIAIGINVYRHIPPLKYAKNDAQFFSDFLRKDAGFEQVWYSSDNSPEIDGDSTEPIRSNLITVLNRLSNYRLEGIDNLWFFFAGHGIHHDGKDYLLMADSNPDYPEETAIPTDRILQKLKSSGATNVILFLDACRSVGTRGSRGIGDSTTEVVKKISDTVCFFSCSPNQFSHEHSEYERGIFTYALLEGLGDRHKLATVDKLESFLKERVPKLAEGINAKQDPRVVNDSREKNLILMPKYADKRDLAQIRADAFEAFSYGKWDVARSLWMQYLEADGADKHLAIAQIERIAQVRISGNQFATDVRASVAVNNPELLTRQANLNTVGQRLEIAEKQLLSIDCGSGVTLELVRVPAGKFMMGSNEKDNEHPIHEVQLKEFLIGKYAVTNAQWQAVMKTKGANKDKKFQGDLQPVVSVSWHGSREFCRKLSELSGKEVRLPTETEWEYAARGGNQSRGFKYAGSNNIDEVAWYGKLFFGKTFPVGQKKANELGIYDMSGNVWEWCLDERHDSYKDKPEQLKKSGNEAWGDLNVDDNDNRSRLLRGGSWDTVAQHCRSAYRYSHLARNANNNFGFRVVCVVR